MKPLLAARWIPLLLATAAPGCASYQGSARDASQQQLAAEQGWSRLDRVQLVRQKGPKDCGAAALSTVLRYWEPEDNGSLERETIDKALRKDPHQGLAASALRDYARDQGFSAFVLQGGFADLTHELELGRPVIVGTIKPVSSGEALSHYEVFVGYNPEKKEVLTLDPAHGLRQNDVDAFEEEWKSSGNVTLIVLPPDAQSS